MIMAISLGIDLHYANCLAHNVNGSDGGGDRVGIQVEKVQFAALDNVSNAPVRDGLDGSHIKILAERRFCWNRNSWCGRVGDVCNAEAWGCEICQAYVI